MGVGGILAGILGLGVILAVSQKFLGVNPLSALGQGIGQFGAGIQTAVSDIFSPHLTPSLDVSLGLNLFGVNLSSTKTTSTSTDTATKKSTPINYPKIKWNPAPDFGQMLIDWRGMAARETGAWDASG